MSDKKNKEEISDAEIVEETTVKETPVEETPIEEATIEKAPTKKEPKVSSKPKSKITKIEIPKLDASPLNRSPLIKRPYASKGFSAEPESVDPLASEESTEPLNIEDNGDMPSQLKEAGSTDGSDGFIEDNSDRVEPFVIKPASDEEDEEEELENVDEGQTVDPEVAKEGAKQTATFLLNGFKFLAPEIAHNYSKIDEEEVSVAEAKTEMIRGSYERVKQINISNKEQFSIDPALIKMAEKPLIDTLTVAGLNVSPPVMLLIAVMVICVTMFMTAYTVKKSNESALAQMIARNQEEEK